MGVRGRPKGAKSKNICLGAWVNHLISTNLELLEQDFKTITPKERLEILAKLLNYVIPKQNLTINNIDFDKLSDEQINQLINKLK